MAECKACIARGQTWIGNAPKCSFTEDGLFTGEGWNCATANLIREIVYEGQELPYWVNYQYCDDDKYAVINIDDLDDVPGLALWVAWYKNRGRTDAMWILDSYMTPRVPTEDECVAIATWHKARLASQEKK